MSFNLFDDDDEDGGDSLFSHTAHTKRENEQKDEEKLPDLPFSKPEEPPKIEKPPEEPVAETEKEPEPEKVEPKEIIQEKEKIPEKIVKNDKNVKRTGKKIHTKYDVENSLNLLKDDLKTKFDEIHLKISSLKPPRLRYKHVALSNAKIVEQVKSIVLDSAEKDRELKELEKQIEMFSDAFTEREERETLREKIHKLTQEFEEYKKKAIDNSNLSSYVSTLDSQLAKVETDYKKSEELERSANQANCDADRNRCEAEKKALNDKLLKAENDVKENEELLKKIKEENEKLNSIPIPDYNKEIKEFKEKRTQAVKKVVSMISSGTFETIQSAIKLQKSYPGSVCINAIKTALMEQADEIVGGDDDDEYEYDD